MTKLDMPSKRSGSTSPPADDVMARQPPRRPAPADPPHYSAERVRGGEIVLSTRAERLVFLAGLAGAVFLAVALAVAE